MTGQDLIVALQELIGEHGDHEMIFGPSDEEVTTVEYNSDEGGAFVLD